MTSDNAKETLVIIREEARMLLNFGEENSSFTLLEGEQLALISREGIAPHDNRLTFRP